MLFTSFLLYPRALSSFCVHFVVSFPHLSLSVSLTHLFFSHSLFSPLIPVCFCWHLRNRFLYLSLPTSSSLSKGDDMCPPAPSALFLPPLFAPNSHTLLQNLFKSDTQNIHSPFTDLQSLTHVHTHNISPLPSPVTGKQTVDLRGYNSVKKRRKTAKPAKTWNRRVAVAAVLTGRVKPLAAPLHPGGD